MDNEWNNPKDSIYVTRVNDSQANARYISKPFDLLHRKSGKCFVHHFVPTDVVLCRNMIEIIRHDPPRVIKYDSQTFNGELALELFLCYIVDTNPQYNGHLPKFIGDLVLISFPKHLPDSLTTLGWRNEGLYIYTSKGLKPLYYKDFDYGSQHPDMYFPKYPLDYFCNAFNYGTTTYVSTQVVEQFNKNMDTIQKFTNNFPITPIPKPLGQRIERDFGPNGHELITWCKANDTIVILTIYRARHSWTKHIHPLLCEIDAPLCIDERTGDRIFYFSHT